MNDERKPYVRFMRDDWGIARRQQSLLVLDDAEYRATVDLLRQIKGGWLVPESEAREVR